MALRLRFEPRWLDRIVRGRAWIPVLGVLLVGIVGMRVEVLKLNSSVGRSTALATQLQSMNQTLRDRVSVLSSESRIARLATDYGMRMPGPMDVHFVPAHRAGGVARAIAGLSTPTAGTYLTGLETELAANGERSAAIGPGTAATAAGATG